MANSARARSTCAAGALSERLKRVSSWRSSAVSGRRGSFRWRDMGHLGARGSPHHYTRAHGRRPTSIVPDVSLRTNLAQLAFDRLRGGDGAVVGKGLMIGLNEAQVIEIVGHEPH